MTQLPNDLISLPTMPYDERPVELPLDVEECRTALWMVRGNVSQAAAILKVSSLRLRTFIKGSKRLTAEQQEMQEILLDTAEDVAFEALTDPDTSRKDAMARFVMTNLGKDRGYGNNAPGKGVVFNLPGKGSFTVAWDDGTNITAPPEKVIDHHG